LLQDIDQTKIQKGRRVTEIDTKCDGCVKVSLSNGDVIEAKWVISTIPFGAFSSNLFPKAQTTWWDAVGKFKMGNCKFSIRESIIMCVFIHLAQ